MVHLKKIALIVTAAILVVLLIAMLVKSGFHNNVQNVLNSPNLLILPDPLRYNQVDVPV